MAEERWHDFAKEKPSEDMEGRNFIVSNGHYEKIATWCGYWENEPFMGDRLCDEVVRWKFYLTPEEEKANEATCKELKAITAYEANWKATSNGDNSVLVYLKSEADKVIAEKDAEIAELKNYADEVNKDFELVDNQNERLLKIVRHNKYKRCLLRSVIAEMNATHFKDLFYGAGSEALADEYNEQITIHYKWQKRWLALADKYGKGK